MTYTLLYMMMMLHDDDIYSTIQPHNPPPMHNPPLIQLHKPAPIHPPPHPTCGSTPMYCTILSTATISCSVSALLVNNPFSNPVMGNAYASTNPNSPGDTEGAHEGPHPCADSTARVPIAVTILHASNSRRNPSHRLAARLVVLARMMRDTWSSLRRANCSCFWWARRTGPPCMASLKVW